jgi:RNA polymerase sigma-70 factor (ECF subfamily)
MPATGENRADAESGLSDQNRIDEFIRLFTSHEPRLRAYVLTLVPRWSDAEEIMQQCNLVLWKKFGQFQSGTNFFAWACRIARLEVMEFRRQQSRDRMLFTDAFLETLADEASDLASDLSARQHALQGCLERLPGKHRRMLQLRYMEGGSIEAVARAFTRSVEAAYRMLSRIRELLHDCITRRLAMEEQ